MIRVVSVTKRPLVAELSLMLSELGVEYSGFVLNDEARSTYNVAAVPMSYGTRLPIASSKVAFFPECDEDLLQYVYEAMVVGTPVVMYSGCQIVPVEHEKTGMLYGNCVWATRWIRELSADQKLRDKITAEAKEYVTKLGIKS